MQVLDTKLAMIMINKAKHFKHTELACKCCGLALMDDLLIPRLDKLRELFGKPLTINSGYRCVTHNKAVGGSLNSKHCLGQAVDISIAKFDSADIHKLLTLVFQLGFSGVELPSRQTAVLHIDIRANSTWIGYYP